MLTKAQIETLLHTPSSNTFHSNTIHHAHLHLHICYYHLPKNAPKQIKEKVCKKCETSHVGMHSHQQTLSQKPMKQATMHIAMHAQTTHTSQRNAFTARVATIPTSFQPHPPQSVPRPLLNWTPIVQGFSRLASRIHREVALIPTESSAEVLQNCWRFDCSVAVFLKVWQYSTKTRL